MTYYLVLVALTLLGLVLQATFFTGFTIAGVKPDLVLILVVFNSLFQGHKEGTLAGFFLGLFEDLYLGRFLGMNALAKGLTSLVSGWLAARTFRENLLVPVLAIFLGTVFNQFVFFVFGNFLGFNWTWGMFLRKSWPMAVYNTCLVPLMYSYFYYWAIQDVEKGAL